MPTERALLLTRIEAARRCSMSVDMFDEQVRPFVRSLRIGGRVFIMEASLVSWLESRAVGPGVELPAPAPSPALSASHPLSARGRAILERLQRRVVGARGARGEV